MKTSVTSEQLPNRVAGLLILAEVVTVIVPVVMLGKYFEFPDVLRQPAEHGLTLFRRNQAQIVPAYYVFMVSGLLFLPLSYAFNTVLKSSVSSSLRQALVGAGTATAVFQSIGFSRWLFIIPYLAEQYARQVDQRPTIVLLYETLNRYAGMTIGEHLGFLAMGVWTLLLAYLLWQHGSTKMWFAGLGLPIGMGLLVSIGEQFGGSSAALFGTINFIANTGWSIWMLALGLWLLFRRSAPTPTSALRTVQSV